MALAWKVVHGGKTPPPGEVVHPDEFVEDTSRADEGVEDDLDDRTDER
ncbi:MAG TPA: hypothetical protein VFE49_00740 [Jiangellaceae bacterium]|jgi:hypothetical protein|nr:hypothetical protein [Jiangellaceae bacterium]